MGGLDICDQLMEACRTYLKTNKLTLKVILHFIDLASVNALLEYKEDRKKIQVPTKKMLDLFGFKIVIEAHRLLIR
jgi:hypothetical protein